MSAVLSSVQLFATPWTEARQAALSMGFSRQEDRSRLPFPLSGDLPCVSRQIFFFLLLSQLGKWLKPSPKYHLQLKTKEDVEGGSLGLHRGGRQFTWKWRNKCLVNRCLLDQMEKMGCHGLWSLGPAKLSPLTLLSSQGAQMIILFLDQALYPNSLGS